MAYKFTDLVNCQRLQGLAELLYQAAGIPVGIVDVSGDILVGAGWQDICTRFHRCHPETARRCRESDDYIKHHLENDKNYIAYKCKNGLWDLAMPIRIGGLHLATLFVGQFFYKDEGIDREYFRNQALQFGFDPDAYLNALEKVPRFGRNQVENMMAYYKVFVDFLSEIGLKELRLRRELAREKQSQSRPPYQESQLRTILDGVQNGILIADEKTHQIVDANPAALALVNATQEAVIGQLYERFISLEGKGNALPSSGAPRKTEAVLISPEGDRIPVLYTAVSVPLGEIPHLIISFTDIRAVKAAEAQRAALELKLQHAQRMESIGILAGGIAHDFNNILFPIMGYAEMTMSLVPPESRARNNLQKIVKSAERAKSLATQILSFTRAEEEKLKPLQLQFVIKETLKMLRSLLPRTIAIENGIDVKCGPVMGDPAQVHQLVMNLCVNAYHAMGEKGGTLTVKLREREYSQKTGDTPPGQYTELVVSDTGPGINPELMDAIFDPYFTTKDPEREKGSGLGLYVVKGIVGNHQGYIQVENSPGQGASFYVRFPRIQAPKQVQRSKRKDAALVGGDERVLVVDDEEIIIGMFDQLLKKLGYQVKGVTDANTALALFSQDPRAYDLVITDMTMPHMTGLELTQKFLEIRPDLPVILCTGYSDAVTEEGAKAAGVRQFVMKPVVMGELARAIRQALKPTE